MKLLMYKWNVFNQEDIKEAFENAGVTVDEVDKADCDADLVDMLAGYDAVFTVNFFIEVSNACKKAGIMYICWTVDSPMLTMYDNAVYNECNRIFVFDRICYHTFKNMGVTNIYYLPLAVNARRTSSQLADMTPGDRKRFTSEVSFVGGLYYKNSYDEIYDKLTPYLAGYFDSALQAQGDLFGDNVFDRIFTPDIIEQLSEIVDFRQSEDSLSDIATVFKNTFLGYKHAQLSRIQLLNLLAARLPVSLYSDSQDERLIGVRYRGTVDYMQDMPKVFNCSKVNINLTICNIRSGIPLRVWDIMGSGGFVLTNYQTELPEYFQNGRELVFYESFDDCLRKAEYYITHEDERKSIAENGFNEVLKHHSYDARIEAIISCCNIR